MDVIDTSSEYGRDVLLPYLDSEDPDIAVAAAGASLWSHTELAKGHLKHIHATCVSEPSFTAMNILFFKGKWNVCKVDPRFSAFEIGPGLQWLDDDDEGAAT